MERRLVRLVPLTLVVLIYLVLCAATVRGVGVVGEVAAGWVAVRSGAAQAAPQVAADMLQAGPVWAGPPLTPNAGHRLGPLVASQTRPLERWDWPVTVPLAINTYTGGLADWPARLVFAWSSSFRAVVALHVLLGLAVLLWVYHVLSDFPRAAGVAGLFLATDWSFIYYRKVLGGTELVLLLAGVLLLWSVWRSRWHAGSGAVTFTLAAGFGLQAKLTFAVTLVAVLVASLITRRDRPRGAHVPRWRWGWMALGVVLLCAPLWVTWIHRGWGLPAEPRIWSHDTFSMQVQRLLAGWEHLLHGPRPGREGTANILYHLLEPLWWFPTAYGGRWHRWGGAVLRVSGWLAVLAGTGLAWARQEQAPRSALLRLVSLVVPLQVAGIWLVNRDLHHLAQVQCLVAIWVGLSADELVRRVSPGAVGIRRVMPVLLVSPFAVAGVGSLAATDTVLAELSAHVFTTAGQQQLVDMLRQQRVTRLWTSDYDLYGVFEVLAPDIQARHAWGAVSHARRRDALVPLILDAAVGGHWLVVRPSAPMIYNLHPAAEEISAAAARRSLAAREVARLEDAAGPWAWLMEVERAPQ